MSRTVLVTGASGGIGAAVARAFAALGDRVALGCHQNPAAAQALQKALAQKGGQALACKADVADSAQVADMFAQAEAAFGEVEVLVCCAGTAEQKLFGDITDADWRRMLAVHADGAFYCARRALPAMLRKKAGVLLFITSMWGQVGASCEVHYSAAKAAVAGMAKALAKEVAPSGVRVNCIAPGAIATAMMDGFTEAETQQLCGEIPLRRLGTPEEVAAAAVFLASDSAAYITGQQFAPNGGMVL